MSLDTRKILIAPSILSADLANLSADLKQVETADYVHFDVMDGHFVPNLTFGPGMLAAVKAATDVPVDAHLMISNPDEMVPAYLEAGADIVTFHLEATNHANRVAAMIREHGAKAGVAINPATPVIMLEDIIDYVDLVLVMSVNPGFGGQKFIPTSLKKLRQVKHMCSDHRVSPLIEVDGGVSEKNAEKICHAGANVLVAGSAVFHADDRAKAIAAIRAAGESANQLKA
ncbi:MAG: ribulose-phosphate 3-epimerase [Tractidigestivibacter sp.]|jgi:ribulose-phosphate 3-epimerase|uniref:ribulose-phosphate 3-epimerase n=1 Tax=Tractidigestivibacter sp. TaxID=2847320 RepID=UPI003D8BC089